MKEEKFSQEFLYKILNNNCTEYAESKYNNIGYLGYKPHNLEILKFVYRQNIGFLDSPHYLCKCDCGKLALKKCNHVIKGTVKTCGLCSKSKYNSVGWVGLRINNYEIISISRHEDQMYFTVKCLNCDELQDISASGLLTGVFNKCKKCYNTINYKDITYVNITDKHKYVKETDEYIVGNQSINNIKYYITQCKRCGIQRLRKVEDVKNLNFGKFTECICKRIKTGHDRQGEHEKRQRRFEYYKSYTELEGTKHGKLKIKRFNLADTLRESTFTCDCDCGRTDIKVGAYQLYNGRTTQCGNCLVAHNEKYSNIEYIGKVFRFLKVLSINKRDSKIFWKCKCLNCGRECEYLAHSIVYGNNSSCGCMVSVYEKLIADILDEYKIEFGKQCTFNGLIGIGGGKLRFDFICKSKDGRLIAIEYDGKHHYMPVQMKMLR